MAGEGGSRPYWHSYSGVNISNGNFHLVLGSGSCVTCGGSAAGAFPNPRSTALAGPVLVYNTLGTADSDLGPKWMLPYHTYLTVDGSGNVTLIDPTGRLPVVAVCVAVVVVAVIGIIVYKSGCNPANPGPELMGLAPCPTAGPNELPNACDEFCEAKKRGDPDGMMDKCCDCCWLVYQYSGFESAAECFDVCRGKEMKVCTCDAVRAQFGPVHPATTIA